MVMKGVSWYNYSIGSIKSEDLTNFDFIANQKSFKNICFHERIC